MRRPRSPAAAVAAWALLPGASAAGGASIFKLGDYIDHKPWELMAMFLTVFAITLLYEWLVEIVEHKTKDSHVAATTVQHVFSEVMILGGISAILTVFENLGGTAYFEAALFHYVHFVIFLMAVFFIAMVSVTGISGKSSWKHWSRFEFKVIEIETDPSLDFESKTAFLHQFVQTVPEGQRKLSCLIYFRQCLPKDFRTIGFERYVEAQQGQLLLEFLDLKWYSWVVLGMLCLVIAIGTACTQAITDETIANVAGWVFFVGYGSAVLFLIIFYKIRREYQSFTNTLIESHAKSPNALAKVVLEQKHHFWRHSPKFLMAMIQALLLIQEFYLANCVANFTYRLSKYSTGPIFVILSFLPPFIIFLVLLPRTMPRFVILSSLGSYLDINTLERIVNDDRASGKYRRRGLRERLQVRSARVYRDDEFNLFHRFFDSDSSDGEESVVGSPRGGPQPAPGQMPTSPRKHGQHDQEGPHIVTDEGLLAVAPPHHHGHHGHGHGHSHGTHIPDVICEECDVAPAGFACGECGFLCSHCMKAYHSLRRFSGHKVFKLSHALYETAKPLLTDNPVINKELTAAALYRKHGSLEEVIDALRAGSILHPVVTQEVLSL